MLAVMMRDIGNGIRCHSVSCVCICGLSESGIDHACVDVTDKKTKNATFATLARSTSEVESIRTRNVWVLKCVPGDVGSKSSDSCGLRSFLNGDK